MIKLKTGKMKGVVAALLVAAAGCIAQNELAIYKERPARFSHDNHVTKEGMQCEECHLKALEADEAGMPGAGTCKLCHGSDEDVAKHISPFLVDGKVKWTNVTALSDDLKFSHQAHAAKNVACNQCHQGIETSKAVSAELRISKDGCNSCHQRNQASSECSACHNEIGKDWKPASHEMSWERRHGTVVRSGLEPPYENRCSLCHTEETCMTCHQAEAPKSHTNAFRTRDHGMMARMDRETCATCHKTDSCDRCHRETTPRNHRGGWGSPRDRHCYTCHFPAGDQGCFTCHKTMNGHLEAPPRPNNVTHDTASEAACRDCHNSLGTLTHPDSGDSCRICHR